MLHLGMPAEGKGKKAGVKQVKNSTGYNISNPLKLGKYETTKSHGEIAASFSCSSSQKATHPATILRKKDCIPCTHKVSHVFAWDNQKEYKTYKKTFSVSRCPWLNSRPGQCW